jgi:pimeloyl-ACP methyl ester carboxylesterase
MPRPAANGWLAGAVCLLVFGVGPQRAIAQLPFCGPSERACARLTVPLDPSGQVPGTVSLKLERAVAKAPKAPPVLLLAGGPGQSATRAFPQDAIKQVFGRVRRDRDVVVFDQRGTGGSGALNCPSLQRQSRLELSQAAAQCAMLLGPARAFYTTADSVADIEAVRRALGYERIALFAVSYGTVVAQQFARTHPSEVDRLVLDSPVAPTGLDPLQRASFAASPRVLRDLCRGRCDEITPDAARDLRTLTHRLQRAPLRGSVVTARGRRRSATLTESDLFSLLLVGDLEPSLRARTPAVVRSAVAGDAAPILRLERTSEEEPEISRRDLSAGTLAATLCEETALPWTPEMPFDQRAAEARARVGNLPPSSFAPFDADTALDSDELRLCQRWPTTARAPLQADSLPDVPALIISGTQDLRTPLEDTVRLARQWPHAQLVEVPAVGHSVVGTDTSGCAVRSVQRFLESRPVPRQCPPGAPLDPAPIDPTSLRAVKPARGTHGRSGRTLAAVRRTYQDALHAYFDVFINQFIADPSTEPTGRYAAGGLRAGYYRFASDRATLHDLSYVPGVRVSGRLRSVSILPDGVLRIHGRTAAHGTLRVHSGRLSGRLAGVRVRGTLGPDLFDLAFSTAFPARAAIASAQAGPAFAQTVFGSFDRSP